MTYLAPRVLLHVALAACLLTLLVGCGVRVREPEEPTELFHGMRIIGDRLVGEPLTVELDVTPTYPVPVRIACYYSNEKALTRDQTRVRFEERATLFGETVLAGDPTRKPGEKVPIETLTYTLVIDAPGEYLVACVTTAAPENGWALGLRVR